MEIKECEISKVNYVKRDNNYFYDELGDIEQWEHDKFVKQNYISSEQIALFQTFEKTESENPINCTYEGEYEWQTTRWEENIILDSEYYPKLFDKYYESYINCSNVSDIDDRPIRYRKYRKRPVLNDIYPIETVQDVDLEITNRGVYDLFLNQNEKMIINKKHKSIGNGDNFNGSLKLFKTENINYELCSSSVVLYETSEENPPIYFLPCFNFTLYSYHNCQELNLPLNGIPRKVKKKSPFLGDIGLNETQLALENEYLRVPVFQHSLSERYFQIVFYGKKIRLESISTIYLGGRQMPLTVLPYPDSQFFMNMVLKCIQQKLLDEGFMSVTEMGYILSRYDFLQLGKNLDSFASIDKEKNCWKIKMECIGEVKGLSDVRHKDFVKYASIAAYLETNEFFPSFDIKNKTQKKLIDDRNVYSPWKISEAYQNGLYRGYWKHTIFEEPICVSQRKSYEHQLRLVSKKLIEKMDLRKLTKYELSRLVDNTKRFHKRWDLVKMLSSKAAVDGDEKMLKFARDTNANRSIIRNLYKTKRNEAFSFYRKMLSATTFNIDLNYGNDVEEQGKNWKRDFQEFLKKRSTDNENKKNNKNAEFIKLNNNEKKTNLTTAKEPLLKMSMHNARKVLLSKPIEIVIYEMKDGEVIPSKYDMNEIVTDLMRQMSNGIKNMKRTYGIVDRSRKNQQQKDQERRKMKYKMKKMKENVPLGNLEGMTTDKVCGSCGQKGHIRTNRECPNFKLGKSNKPDKLNERNQKNTDESKTEDVSLKMVFKRDRRGKYMMLDSNKENVDQEIETDVLTSTLLAFKEVSDSESDTSNNVNDDDITQFRVAEPADKNQKVLSDSENDTSNNVNDDITQFPVKKPVAKKQKMVNSRRKRTKNNTVNDTIQSINSACIGPDGYESVKPAPENETDVLLGPEDDSNLIVSNTSQMIDGGIDEISNGNSIINLESKLHDMKMNGEDVSDIVDIIQQNELKLKRGKRKRKFN